ncbi:MAG TPA: sulfatase-like hydrolase/transferase [Pirellulales bacterium]|jgi:peptidoglycan/LPS O-acetylase OafA/YrhL|nr:sulfatase-like hydrolase/transferase [Pirellulales bacterium]
MTDQNPASAAGSKVPRFAMLDSIRGIAALAVACYHFHGVLAHGGKATLFGPVLDWLCEQGHLGVEVFFVLSGFVLTHVLRPLRLGPTTLGRFMLRRSVRLDPAYWAVLLATILVNVIATDYGLAHRPSVSIGAVLANMFYLQDLLDFTSPVHAAWTLCMEMQFYLFFFLSLWVFQSLRQWLPIRVARLLVFAPPAAISLLMAAGYLPSIRGLFLDYWHLFFFGVLAYWCLMGVLSSIWFWIYTVFLVVLCQGSILGGVGGGLAILAIGRLGLLDFKMPGRFLPYIGSRSYSLYLVHALVGSNLARLLLHTNWVPETFLVLTAFFFMALAASILAAEILYRLIEWPSHVLARRIAWESPSAAPAVAGTEALVLSPVGAELGKPAAGGLFANAFRQRWPVIVAAIRAESTWLIPVSLFAVIWLLELYVIQGVTLSPGHTVGRRFDFYAPKIRFLMDVCFVGACISLLDRRGLIFMAIGSSILNLTLLTYFDYFRYPLSLLHVFQNFREGMALSAFAWDLLDGATVFWLGFVLVIKLIVLRPMPTASRWRSPAWLGFFGAFAIGYVALFTLANHVDPLERIAAQSTLGRLGIIRGYLGPWISEFYYLNDDRLIQRAVERRDFKSDQLAGKEIPLMIEPRLVIIQAESLDRGVIGYSADGREVTPFLNRLRDQAMYFRVKVFHYQGSCDSDFTMLEGVAATPRVNAYYMPNYPFENSLPQILKQHGYHPFAFHGNHAGFYNRGWAFFKMGFERSLFLEQLESDFGMPVTRFGVTDQEVLRLSSHMLKESREPTCHFIITLTSHTPFNYVATDENSLYPRPANKAEWYFNSMRYLDDCLKEYVMSLPSHTTLVLYGDHCTDVETADFASDRGDNTEFVPCFIYDTDRNLAEEQRTRDDPISIDGTLNLLDISTYLRNRITAVDSVTRRKEQPARVDSKPVPPRPVETQPANSPSKQSASSPSAPVGDPVAQRPAGGFSVRAPDNP